MVRGNRHGFTIVELLMVIGIMAVLMGIVTTAASSSIKSARSQKASALCTMVQAGLATYREQKGEWPSGVNLSPKSNSEGVGGNTDVDKVELSAEDVRKCVKALVDETKKGNPMMDISGLFVARQDNELETRANNERYPQKKVYGMDFMQAIRGTKQSRKKMKTSEMYFGYPDKETGCFLRFKMIYSIPGDVITVSVQ